MKWCVVGGGHAVSWDHELKQLGGGAESKGREIGTHKCAQRLDHSSSVRDQQTASCRCPLVWNNHAHSTNHTITLHPKQKLRGETEILWNQNPCLLSAGKLRPREGKQLA